MSFEMFSVILAEDEIMRQALQEIWEMGQEPSPVADPNPELERIFKIVNKAVEDIDALAKIINEET